MTTQTQNFNQPQFQQSQFPNYLSGNPNQNLQQFQGQIPKLYNFAPIQATGNQYIQSNFDQQRASAAAQAAAAQNRAIQSGGQVGASFAQAGAMLPLYNQRNMQAFDLAKLQGQMRESQAGLMGQTATSMDQNAMQRAAQQSQYGLAQQNMASQNEQFSDTFGLQQQQLGLQKRQFDLSLLRGAPQQQGPRYSFQSGLSRLNSGSQQYPNPDYSGSDNQNPYQQGSAGWSQRYAALQY